MAQRPAIPEISSEFEAAKLGDKRLTNRLMRLASAATKAPGDSFPRMVGADGELEGVYRFLSNTRVSMGAILEPHIAATRERSLHGRRPWCFMTPRRLRFAVEVIVKASDGCSGRIGRRASKDSSVILRSP
jgi:hypothetical protein